MFIIAFTTARQMPTSSAKWIQVMSSQPISSKVILKLAPLLCLGIARVSFLPVLEPKSSPYTSHTPPTSHLSLHDLITPNNIRRGVNITKLIIMEFSPYSSYFLHLKPKTPYSPPYSRSSSASAFLLTSQTKLPLHIQTLRIFPSSAFTYFLKIRKIKY